MWPLAKQVPSVDQKALTKLYGDVVLRECKDQELVLKYVSVLIDRLSKLYQIQNWTAENTVILAEWIIETYSCEMLATIDKVLRRPPKSEENNWRLTPDTITRWMEAELERLAVERENWNHNMKGRTSDNKLMDVPEVLACYERMMLPSYKKEKDEQSEAENTEIIRQREIDGEHKTNVQPLTRQYYEHKETLQGEERETPK